LAFPKTIQQGFVFEDVGFKYHNSERWANRHLNFTLFPGEKLALVGENGAGKTTLVKLLSRLIRPYRGQDSVRWQLICVNMIYLICALNVGVIFQDYLRYQMTFAQNIAVGNINTDR
jgi:ATP-binding cassette subfamily B protein